jgi:hypothetical protein
MRSLRLLSTSFSGNEEAINAKATPLAGVVLIATIMTSNSITTITITTATAHTMPLPSQTHLGTRPVLFHGKLFDPVLKRVARQLQVAEQYRMNNDASQLECDFGG